LAIANTSTSARQLAAVVTSLVLAVALGGSLWFVQTSEEHTAARQVRAGLIADYVVTPAANGVPADAAAALRQVSGVRAATGVVHSTVFAKHDDITDFTAEGIDAADVDSVVNLGVTAGSLADLHGNTVAIDSLAAASLHLRVGGEFAGWFGDGTPTSLRVVAIYTRGLGFAQLTVPHDVLIAHTTSGLDDSVLVATRGASPATVAALRSALRNAAPGATVVDRDRYRTALDADLVQNGWTNRVVTAVLVVYVAIAAVNTLVTYALGRRRQFAVLRLSGTTRKQVLRMVRLEQVLLVGIALVVGVAIAAATLVPMVKGITGSATPYVPLVGWLAVIGGTVVLSAAATVVPVRRTLRMAPVEAIGIRD
jgi:putative ABC transport system permease protein